MKLSVDPGSGRVRLVLPTRAKLAVGLAWVEDNRAWIAEQRARLPQERPFLHDTTIPIAGEQVRLVWDEDAPRSPRRSGDQLIVGGPHEGFEGRVLRWLRAEALRVLTRETAEYALAAGVTVDSVGVGDPRSRWGSCTWSGAIRYSWRLILAPSEVRRATVAHEVAHRVHMNHSPAFHAVVARIFEADPTPMRRWLKANGASLYWYGRAAS